MATYVRLRGLSRRPFRVSATQKINYSTIQTVDLDDLQTLRYIRTSGEGRYITASDNYFNLSIPAVATSGTASGVVVRAPKDLVIKGVDVTVGSSTGTALFDVKYCAGTTGPNAAGTSVFGGTNGTALLLGTGTVAVSNSNVVNTTWSKGDYLRVEVPAVSGTATNAMITIRADQI